MELYEDLATLPPIVCTCGKIIGNLYDKYKKLSQQNWDVNRLISKLRDRPDRNDLLDILMARGQITEDQAYQILMNPNITSLAIAESFKISGIDAKDIVFVLVSKGYVPTEVYQAYVDKGMTPEQMLERIEIVFSNDKMFKDIGLNKYCCREKIANPQKFPIGGGIKLGAGVRTREDQMKLSSNIVNTSNVLPNNINSILNNPNQIGRVGLGSQRRVTVTDAMRNMSLSATPQRGVSGASQRGVIPPQVGVIPPQRGVIAPQRTVVNPLSQRTLGVQSSVNPMQQLRQRGIQ